MADNPLSKLSTPAQAGIALVIAVLICGGFYFFWWSDATEKETQKSDSLKKLQSEITSLEVTANKLPEFQREVQLLEANLEKLKLNLPTEKQMPDLMKRLQSLTQQATLTLKDFTPGAGAGREFYQEIPIAMTVSGSYHNLGLFFDRVGRLVRLVSVGNVSIAADGSQTANRTINATLVAKTYMYVDTPAKAKGAGR